MFRGKTKSKKFSKWGGQRATKSLEIAHSDMCGPLQTFSHGGAKYFVTFIDAFSRKICGHNLNGEVLEAYKTMVELQTGKQIEMLRIDNGTCLIGVFFWFFF